MLNPMRKLGRPKKEAATTAQSDDQSESQSSSETDEPKERKPRGRGAAQKVALDRIRQMLTLTLTGAGAIAGRANAVDGAIILSGTPALVESIVSLCEQDKRVRDYLYSLTVSSAYLNVTMASLAIIIPVLANHGLLPPLFFASPKVPEAGSNGYENVPASSFVS